MADIFKNAKFALANTGVNLIYTVPDDSRALIKSVQTTNAGANAAAYNVRINLKSITDKNFSSRTTNKLETSLKDCENTLETILKNVEGCL